MQRLFRIMLLIAAFGRDARGQAVSPSEILAHPDRHPVVVAEGRLTAPTMVVPGPRQGVFRRLIGSRDDSLMVFIPISADTFPIGRIIRIGGTVHAASALGGLVRTGPLLIVATDTVPARAAQRLPSHQP
jgi:hypothetical protein